MRRPRELTLLVLWAATALGAFLAGSHLHLSATRAASSESGSPWWRTSFPPRYVTMSTVDAHASFDPHRVLPGVTCGNFDGLQSEGDGGLYLWGWALDPRVDEPAIAVLLLAGDHPVAPPVHVFRERADVVEATGKPALLRSGWSLWIPAQNRPSGELVAYAQLTDGSICELGRKQVPR